MDPAKPSALHRWYRQLLRLLPFEFRADFGADMESDFVQQRLRSGARGRRGVVRLAWDTLVDLARTAPAAHFDTLRQDVRFALRAMRRNRTFTLVSVLTLGLGVGLNGAVFSLVESILLRPPPYPEPERLAMVWSANPANGWSRSMISLQDFEALRDRARTLDGLAAWTVNSGNLTGGGEAERVAYALVSDRFFRVLGVEPARGRGFTPGEDRPGQSPVVVVSDGFWRRRLGSDPAALGQALTLDGEAVTVVGIMPPDFDFPAGQPGAEKVELWRPLGLAGDDAGEGRWLLALARLGSQAGPAAVETDLEAVAASLAVEKRETNQGWVFYTEPLHRVLVTNLRPRLFTLWAAVGLVLLITCANLASLLLVRSTARRRELVVRSVLGARRLRIVRQLLTESSILALAGGCVGLLLAVAVLQALPAFAGAALPPGWEPRLDLRVIAFTFAVAAIAAVLSVLPAAARASRVARGGGLGSGDRGTAGRSPLRTRSALVAAEVAIALVVLVAAGLLLRSLVTLSRTDPGFRAENLLVLRVEPPMRLDLAAGGGEEEIIRAYLAGLRGADTFYGDLLTRIDSIPGVRRAGAVNRRPLVGGWDARFAAEGRPSDPASDPLGNERVVMPGYFRALGVPLIAGRPLAAADDQRASPAAVISRALAEAMWPGESAIGRLITTDLPVGDGSFGTRWWGWSATCVRSASPRSLRR